MKRLFVVPHAEATHHVDQLVGGWFDSELTPTGRAQAESIASALSGRVGANAVVYSSDLKRATQTAAPIASTLGTEPVTLSSLREVSTGIAEGKPNQWLQERIRMPPPGLDALDHEIVEGAETRRTVVERIARCLADIESKGHDDVVVVTHGFAGSFVIGAWLRMPVESLGLTRFHLHSGSISELEADSTWNNRVLVDLNNTSHLDRT